MVSDVSFCVVDALDAIDVLGYVVVVDAAVDVFWVLSMLWVTMLW